MLKNSLRLQSLVVICLNAIAALVCVAYFSNLMFGLPASDLDSGWQFGLNHALANHFIFGKDVVFTMGPYVPTYSQQYHPGTDRLMLAVSFVHGVAFVCGMLVVAKRDWPMLVFVTILLPFLSRDALFIGLPFLYLFLSYRLSLHPQNLWRVRIGWFAVLSMALLLISMALLTLTKGTFAGAVVLSMLISSIMLVTSRHYLLALGSVLVWCASVLVLWAIVQPISALPQFVVNLMSVTSGYTDAMSDQGPRYQYQIFLAGIALIGLIGLTAIRKARFVDISFAAGAALLSFIVFKHAFVRHDGHAWIASGGLAVFGLILWAGYRGVRALAILLICLAVWLKIWSDFVPANQFIAAAAQSVLSMNDSIHARLLGRGELNRRFNEALANIRSRYPFPKLVGSTDIYSVDQSALLANGLKWDPRPIFQSYSAYNMHLLELNAEHIRHDAAPENIIFGIQQIDNHFPPLEDGLSWPTLLAGYEPTAVLGLDKVLLRRKAPSDSRPVVGKKIAAGDYVLGQDVALPHDAGPLWAKVVVKRTFMGLLVNALFKLPPLGIEFAYDEGRSPPMRFIPGMGEAGFLISPTVSDTRDFMALRVTNAEALSRNRVPRSFKIYPFGHYANLWKSAFSLEVYSMTVPPDEKMDALVFQPLSSDSTKLDEEMHLPVSNACSIDTMTGKNSGGPAKIDGAMEIKGWAAVSMREGIAPDTTDIVLIGKDGNSYRAHAIKTSRSDVKAYFNKPNMGDVGFFSVIDLRDKAGSFSLFIEMTSNGKRWICGTPTALELRDGGKSKR